jgi:hypothetical protein
MDYFAGLDVSVKDTSVCIVDGTGKIAREVKVASEPAALLAVLTGSSYRFKRKRLTSAGRLEKQTLVAHYFCGPTAAIPGNVRSDGILLISKSDRTSLSWRDSKDSIRS